MKRLWALAACSFILAACSEQLSTTNNHTYALFAEDIITKNANGIDNIERFYAFYDNVEIEKRDQVRIIEHTIEGAPIYVDVAYADDKIALTVDSTEDPYTAEDLLKTSCRQLNAVEVGSRTDYLLNDCEDNESYILFSDY
ncbi:DUF4362 domain-containing protein [Solibacillus sp. CAU 1738]|uniref:DUF4362 domain-containing protein n=1 Tax=Solibacillus sp. CAU 1738 TaxID=3140363 RepID=UPI003261CBFD